MKLHWKKSHGAECQWHTETLVRPPRSYSESKSGARCLVVVVRWPMGLGVIIQYGGLNLDCRERLIDLGVSFVMSVAKCLLLY